MQLGMIGLGRMGANMVRRLINKGHNCVVFDRSPQVVSELVKEKATGLLRSQSSLTSLTSHGLSGSWFLLQSWTKPSLICSRISMRGHPDRRRQFLLRR